MKLLLPLLLFLGLTGCSAASDTEASSNIDKRFSEADRNKDGVITIDEADRPRLFRQLDRDGDGRVTPEEVRVAVTARRGGGEETDEPEELAAAVETSSKSFKSQLNIPYAQHPGVEENLLSLDVYTPTNTSGPRPVVVMVHGGGWRTGDKGNTSLGSDKAAFFTARGYVYVSINYRLSPLVQHPTHAEDVAAAIAWVVENVKKYGGDPDRLFLMGHSAGAHLAALVVTDKKYLKLHEISPDRFTGVILLDTAGYNIPRNLEELSEGPLNAALYRNAFGSDRATWVDASPALHLEKGSTLPRFLVFYTDRKASGPISREFVEALRKAGAPAWDVLVRDTSHGDLNRKIGQPDDGPSRLILEFLDGGGKFPSAI